MFPASQNVNVSGSKVLAVAVRQGSGDDFILNFTWAPYPGMGDLIKREEDPETHGDNGQGKTGHRLEQLGPPGAGRDGEPHLGFWTLGP